MNWCEVGRLDPAHSDFSAPPDVPGGNNHPVYRTVLWHDEEILAVEDRNGKLVPSGIAAIFYPVPGLKGELDANPDAFTEPTYVGRIYTRVTKKNGHTAAALKAYWKKMRLRPGLPTDIYIEKSAESDTGWKISFVRATHSVSYTAVRAVHTNYDPPGTVRWRWLLDDQETWIRCLQACCTPEDPI
jgi:hypothetical protein